MCIHESHHESRPWFRRQEGMHLKPCSVRIHRVLESIGVVEPGVSLSRFRACRGWGKKGQAWEGGLSRMVSGCLPSLQPENLHFFVFGTLGYHSRSLLLKEAENCCFQKLREWMTNSARKRGGRSGFLEEEMLEQSLSFSIFFNLALKCSVKKKFS